MRLVSLASVGVVHCLCAWLHQQSQTIKLLVQLSHMPTRTPTTAREI